MSSGVSGASSAGLTTIVLPAASAGATSCAVSDPGAFHGTIAPQTPNGSRIVKARASGVAVGSEWPTTLSAWPATYRPAPADRGRPAVGLADLQRLEAGDVQRTLTAQRPPSGTAARRARVGLRSRQAGNAAAAAATAASTSAASPAPGPAAIVAPVAGSTTPTVSPPAAATQSPPTRCAPVRGPARRRPACASRTGSLPSVPPSRAQDELSALATCAAVASGAGASTATGKWQAV